MRAWLFYVKLTYMTKFVINAASGRVTSKCASTGFFSLFATLLVISVVANLNLMSDLTCK